MAGDLPLSCEPIWNSRQQRDWLETSNSKKKTDSDGNPYKENAYESFTENNG